MKKRMRVIDGTVTDVYTRHWADPKTGAEHYEGPSILLTDTGSGYAYESPDKSLRFSYSEMGELLEILEWQERMHLRTKSFGILRTPKALRLYTRVKSARKVEKTNEGC